MSPSQVLPAALLVLSQAAAAALPNAPGRELVLLHCTACHSIDRVEHSGGSKTGWEDRINRMVRWGARIPAGEIAPLATYLAHTLPARRAPPPLQAFFANTAVSTVSSQSVQSTLRVAAGFDAETRILKLMLNPDEARDVRLGQHLRAFSSHARAEVITAKVTQIVKQGSRYQVIAAVSSAVHEPAARYVAEVGIDLGVLVAVPNEAIIDDGDQKIVYVRNARGEFERRAVTVGLHGEKLTEVVSGLAVGEQVVSVGGFFIDAAYKLAAES
jgi:cytochrome c5